MKSKEIHIDVSQCEHGLQGAMKAALIKTHLRVNLSGQIFFNTLEIQTNRAKGKLNNSFAVSCGISATWIDCT